MDILSYPFDSGLILKKKRSIKRELSQKPGLLPKKIAIVSGSTVGEIKNILELFLMDKGFLPEIWEGEYALFYENVVFSKELEDFAPDVLYIHTSNRNIREYPLPSDSAEEANSKLDSTFNHFKAVWEAAKKLGCPVIQNNFEAPLWRNFGSLDASEPRGRVSFTRRLNEKMAEYARENHNFYIHDLDYLASLFGLDSWCDNATWYAYKYCCAVSHIPDLCHSLACLIGSLFGKSKKAVVSDLDNTLWGGVIGEVGSDGVELGGESPAGMAFAEFQGYLKMLASRGIMLNVASKNQHDAAKSGFERSDSPLKFEDFICFEANWEPKSLSVAKIAHDLNIGADSLVFTDDNPAEREIVKQELPMVEAPPVCQPEDSVKLLDRAGYFEVSSLSGDDIKRNEMYRQNTERQKMQQNFADYSQYLLSLEMTAEIIPFMPGQLERISQLINKTNQFNLTTRRYTGAEVEALSQSGEYICLSGRLVDKFGDNGITTAIIGRQQGSILEIDLWVMSCRVFKRDLELAMFDALVAAAKEKGIKAITGSYLPTAKNVIVKDFYSELGFRLIEDKPGKRVFKWDIGEGYESKNRVIAVNENK